MPTIRLICDVCEIFFYRKASRVPKQHYCSAECSKEGRKYPTKPCDNCGEPVTRCQSQMLAHVFCSRACSKKFLSEKMTAMNIALNPDRMIMPTRTKLREARLNTGEGLSYEKTYSRHTHRIVAEQKLGRPLRKGEVVHHEDENRRNNHPDNIFVFKSQAEHAKYHADKRHKAKQK